MVITENLTSNRITIMIKNLVDELSSRTRKRSVDMKKKVIFFIGIMFLLSLFLGACASPKNEKQKVAKTENLENDELKETVTKGRYREEKIDFPVPIKTVFDVLYKDKDEIQILLEDEQFTFYFYESKDSGVTWQQKELKNEWLPEHYRVVSACFGTKEDIIVSAGKISENPLDEEHAIGEYLYFRLNNIEGDFQVNQLALHLPEPKEEYLDLGYGLTQICSIDEKLYGIFNTKIEEELTYQLFCFSLTDGSVSWKLDFDTKPVEIAKFGDKLYLNEYDGQIKTLDKKTGQELPESSISLEHSFLNYMDIKPETNKLFYCNETGIYGTDDTMTLTELLVDGNLSRFSDKGYQIRKFCSVNEQVFFMFLADNSFTKMELFRYEYDAELATQPKDELMVYSLEDSEIVDKIISDFRASHQDIFVKHKIGMQDSSVTNVSDAINILNTEIMAGNGPDILILNGLPWEAYEEKEILMDVSNDLDSYIKEKKVFENIFSAYQKDNAQYVVPISFQFPVIIGEESQVSQIHSIEDLLRVIERIEDMPSLSIEGFLPYVVSIYWDKIQDENDSISKEELKNILEKAKEINDLLQPKEGDFMNFFKMLGHWEEESVYEAFAENFLDVWNVVYGHVALSLGNLSSIREFTAISDHMPNQNLSYQIFSDKVFSSLNMGINSRTPSRELAKEFLEFVLSEKEQKIISDEGQIFKVGFPVNKDAWEAIIAKPSPKELEDYGDIFERLGGTFEWPEQKEFHKLEQKMENLSTPAMEDSIVMHTILESAKPYLSGEKTVDTVVNEITQALELYFTE